MKDSTATTIGVTEFKAHCLALMEEIHSGKRGELIVTKRGKPLVKVAQPDGEKLPIFGFLKGAVTIHGDLTAPTDEDWEALKD
ncbi:MAG: hypothetical protein SFV18_14225 [Bryobacteraceae bacterium]|nr:hypothetical protein [Bryobacteraceae bacterium]